MNYIVVFHLSHGISAEFHIKSESEIKALHAAKQLLDYRKTRVYSSSVKLAN